MKKNINVLVMIVIMTFFCFPTFFQASEKECYYYVPFNGDKNSNKNFTFSVTFTPKILSNVMKTKTVDVKINNTSGKYNVTKTDHDIWNSLNTYVEQDSSANLYMKSCPNLWFKNENSTITIYPSRNTPIGQNGKTEVLIELISVDKDGNEFTGDTENTLDKTHCSIQTSYYRAKDTSNSSSATIVPIERTIGINIDSYSNGDVYISAGNSGGYLKENANGNVALEMTIAEVGFTKEVIRIFNEDVSKIKSKFKYGNTSCGTLVLNRYGNGSEYALSTEVKSNLENFKNSTKLDENYSSEADPDLNIDQKISTKSSSCEKLLGGSNSNLIKFMQSAWTIIKVAVIIITILMGIFDFVGSITKSKDELMACVNKSIKRLVIVVIILLLPTVIDFIGSTIFKVDNILCGIK